MFTTVRHWLNATPIADELRRRHAVTLQLLFLFIGIAVPAVWFPRMLTQEFSQSDAIASLSMAAVAWTAFGLLRIGRYHAAVWLFVGAMQVAIVIAYLSTGLLQQRASQAPHSLALLLAALLIGRRALWIMGAVLLLALFGGTLVDLTANRAAALPAAISVSLSFLMVAIVLDRFATSLVEVLQRERERTAALDEANARIRSEASHRERLQRALNAAQQRDAAELVSSGLAHELNNVLALTYAQLARVGPATTEAQARAFARVKDSLDDAAERVARILRMVRRDELELADVDVPNLIRRLQPDLHALLGPKRCLTLDLQPVPAIRGVETDVAQILLALVANAAESTCGAGAGQVWISLYRCARGEQDGLCLRVADNGRGLTSVELAEAGQSLFSATAVRSGNGDGGLGLATCRALAERLGGTLVVHPGIGSGTEIEVWLPMAQRPVDASERMPNVVDPTSVLLVDDDPDVGALLSFVLSSAGFNVEIAETADAARSAQQRLTGHPQPLMVMDRNLPDGDGVALLEEFARQQIGMRVVFSSVQALKAHERERLKRIQLVELAKPYVPERLVETLRDLGKAA